MREPLTNASHNARTRPGSLAHAGEAYLRAHTFVVSALLAAGLPVHLAEVGWGPVLWTTPGPGESHQGWPFDELALSVRHGETEGSHARRAAELFELTDNFIEARKWWHRAAELGDQDAIDYVNGELAG